MLRGTPGGIRMLPRLLRLDLLFICHRTFINLVLALVVASTAIAAPHKTPPVSALYIHYDSGGQIGSYLSKYSAVRTSGQHVIIDGTCASACTMLLGAVPRNRICVTKNAVLAFHSAWSLTLTGVHASRPGTLYLWAHYPDGVRHWISRHGGLRPETISMRWPEVATLFPVCR
jgi:hypothetical protein